MIVRLNDITPEGLDISFTLDPEKLNQRVNIDETSAKPGTVTQAINFPTERENLAKVSMHLDLIGRDVLIKGRTVAPYQSFCSKCLEPTKNSITSDFYLTLKQHKGNAREDEFDDLDLVFFSGDEINTEEIAEEYLILNLPVVILCSPNCQGLCANCGANLNLSPCNCPKSQGTLGELMRLKGLKI
ncbi:DUF177 domain-containing protein [bacterium]|nr:DUF177 domain-containing protein [bacterium]